MWAQRRAGSLLSAEKRTLEMIANGVNLRDVLNDLCGAIDAHVPGVISTILLIDPDGKRLWPGAGPRFPVALKPAISPWPIGLGNGACGTAAFLKERVIISDVATDPRWPDEFRALAISHGLRASWSQPLVSNDGSVLGTFAMYYGEPRIPDASDLELIEAAGHIALIAIQMDRSHAALREGEQRFRLVANTAPVLIWMSGVDKLCTYFNQSWLQFTGRPLEAELGNGWAEGVHPDDLERCLEIYTKAFDQREPFQMEYRLRRHDGEYRWILDSGVLRFAPDAAFAGYIGSCIDVTERKLAEETLSTMSQRLIAAQEEERSWIARELHDDINQRIALLAINLETLRRDLPASASELQGSLAVASKQAQDIGTDVQALSHRLHNSKLEHLGLERAAASFCAELSHQQEVQIDFSCENIARELAKEVAICLFRILQEALQNARKHSGTRHFQVSLDGRFDGIHLSVRDSGVGFDPNEAMRGRGLGLTSMKERLKLVNGELIIDSQLQRGTTIHARVPLSVKVAASAAAV
jgi:PAS domain S-box-containing protein